MTSTGIYVRVSTEEQAKEGYSIRGQEEKLKSYATLKEWHIYDIYADEGISGKDIDGRPQMKRLITDIEAGKVENVLVFKIDRLTRSTKNLIELMDLFNRYGCAFNSLSEAIDTSTASGRMFLKIVGIFAEFERENLAERLRLGFERKVKEGYTLANYRHTYGYNKEKGTKIQEIDKDEAQIVRRIFDTYINGNSNFTRIAKTLNAEKVPTKMGKRWASITVKEILQNPTYIGKVRYSCRDESRYFEADGHHEPILDEGIFEQAQNKTAKIKRISYTKLPTDGVYFSGILFCKQCGCRYSPKWNYRIRNGTEKPRKMGYPTYRCHNSLKDMGCTARSISHKKLEQAFLAYIARIAEINAEGIETPDMQNLPDNEAERATITAEIAQIDKKTKEVMGLFMSGTLDFIQYQDMVKVGNERKEELTARLGQIQKAMQYQRIHYNKAEIVANILENWQALNNEERQQFVQKFIQKIVIHDEPPTFGRFNEVVIDDVTFYEF